jgi:hypothetical protein
LVRDYRSGVSAFFGHSLHHLVALGAFWLVVVANQLVQMIEILPFISESSRSVQSELERPTSRGGQRCF